MYRRKQSRPIPGQIALPLDYSQSERAAPSRNHVPSRSKRKPWPQVLPATNPARLLRHGFVPASWKPNKPVNSFRQPQRFLLTSLILTLINNVNGKRWRYGTALPPFFSRQVALISDRGAYVGRGSMGGLPAYPLVRYARRTGLSALRLSRQLHLQNAQSVPLQGLPAPIHCYIRRRSSPAARCLSAITSWQSRFS